MIKKYLVQLTNKAEIPIDEDEVDNVIAGISTGKVVKVRQGIFNPSYFVAMIVDQKRIERYYSDNQYRNQGERENRELAPLEDIFGGVIGEQKKQLTSAMRIPQKSPIGIER